MDCNMSQVKMARNIMKSRKHSITMYITLYIGNLESVSIERLKKNVWKYKMINYLIIGKVTKSPFEIKTDIKNNKI